MDPQALLSEHKELIAVVVAGLFSIVAALIKSKMQPSPPLRWFLASVVCFLLGSLLLFLEYSRYPFDPNAELTLSNTGAILALTGCLCVAAGGIWGMIQFTRLFTSSPVPAQQTSKKQK